MKARRRKLNESASGRARRPPGDLQRFEDDVRTWFELIKAKLPSAIDRFITSGDLSKDARELLDEFGSGTS